VILFIGLTVALLLALHLTQAPARVIRLVWLLIGISVLQAALGYTQYFTGLPIALVLLHVTGATVLWITMLFVPGRERVREAVNV
jgi:heme a synthase